MSNNFKPLLFDQLNVGKRIKASKKRYMWKFELDGREHVIDFYVSKLSGRRKILLDGDIKIEAKKSATYGSYPLRIGRHSLLLYEQEDNIFDLRVDNHSFQTSYMRTRAQSEFQIEKPYNFDGDSGIRNQRNDPFGAREEPSYNDWEEPPYQPKNEMRTSLRGEKNDPFAEPYGRASLGGQRANPFSNVRSENSYGKKEDNEVWERYEDFFDKEKNPRATSPEPYGGRRYSEQPRVDRKPAPVPSPPKPVVEEKPKEVKKQADPVDLFDAPYTPATLPTDIFTSSTDMSAKNKSANPYSMQSNPFEFSTKNNQPKTNNLDLVDFTKLDQNKPAANPQTNQFQMQGMTQGMPGMPGMPGMTQGMPGMPQGMPGMPQGMPGMPQMQQGMPGANPMAAMMAYNQFMTGMMMNQYMNSQQPFR